MNSKQYTFSDMQRKMVVNIADGRELGHVCDMIFNNCGAVLGLVVPGKKSFFKSIASSENIFIAWNRIIRIGSDVILTELVGGATTLSVPEQKPSPAYTQMAYEQASCPPAEEPSSPEPTPDTPPHTYYH